MYVSLYEHVINCGLMGRFNYGALLMLSVQEREVPPPLPDTVYLLGLG